MILASYEAGFAAEWGRKARDLIEEFGPEYFGIHVRPDSSAADRWDILGHAGGMRTAGVGGPLTGKGAHLLIVDDPTKNAEEANSETIRAKHQDWWRSTAYTRLEPDGAAIVMATRWHEQDLPGWLLSEAKAGGEQWELLNLPALAEANDPLGRAEGEALWPERFSRERLLEIKKAVGSYWFAALYQGNPQPAEGNKFKRPWFRYWRSEGTGDQTVYRLMDAAGGTVRIVRARDCRRFGTVDLAASKRTSADYTVLAAWAVTPESDLLLLDVVRERLEEPEILTQARAVFRRLNLSYITVEENFIGLGVVQTLRRGAPDRPGLAVRGYRAMVDKLSRATTAIVRCEAGQIYFRDRAPWLADYESELLSFPVGAHDDQVDVTSMAADDVFFGGPAAEPDDRRKAREKAEAEAEAAEKRRRGLERRADPDDPHWWGDDE